MSGPADAVVVEVDGGSRGNPGPSGYGAVVFDGGSGEVLAERSEAIGVQTNNVAEYRGLIAGLTAALELGARRVSVRMDSKLVVEQMSGRWQVKHPAMRPLAREAAALRAQFDEVTFEWIPRSRNAHADRLANEAMDRAEGKQAAPIRRDVALPSQQVLWTPPTRSPTRLILVRHAATAHSVEGKFSGRNDLPLSADGRTQAAALAGRVASLGEVAAVVSSPLRRARETAELIAVAVGHSVETNDDFVEVDFGAWEGLTFAEVRATRSAELDAWLASPEQAPAGGESFGAAARRVRRARDAAIIGHPGRTVVVVTHVTPIKILIRLALDAPAMSLFRIHLDTASVSIVDYYPDGSCSVRLVNDTCRLR